MNNYKKLLIGNTPLVRLDCIEKHFGLQAKLYAKLEWYNLTGSTKDRAALQMIVDAQANGLKKGAMLIEATSGNTGIALSAICTKLGYKAVIVMPENMSEERKMLIKAYGGTLVLTPKSLGMKGAVETANKICAENDGAILTKQFENPSNSKAHYLTTAPEIYNKLKGKVDCFVTGIGTGGTITGVGKFLKEQNQSILVYGVQPKSSPVLTTGVAGAHGIQGIGANFVPSVLDKSLLNGIIDASDDDAFDCARLCCEKQGLFIGISSGASLFGAIQIAKRADMKGKTIVTLFPDSGIKYLSTGLIK